MSRRVGARLDVFLGEERLGWIERRGPARFRFSYSERMLDAHREGSVVLSASLPLQGGAFAPSRSAPFFEGLLPEGSVRAAIARALRLGEQDAFGLLEALGADCAGAVVVLPEGERPIPVGEGRVQPLDEGELARRIEELPRRPLGVSGEPGGVRLSLGGVQHKLVLVRLESGAFGAPLDGAPSTCLLKPEPGEYEDLAANEAFCMDVASRLGLEVAATEVVEVGGRRCLYAERFDRARDGEGRVVRLHQEDMCQALGVMPAAKYEQDGGPSAAGAIELLRRLGSPRAAVDINGFVQAMLVNFLLGNSDAHGKNFALLYEPPAGVRLAPLYDVVSTAVYPELTDRMAMSIGGADRPGDVDLVAWGRLAEQCGLGGQLPALVRRWAAGVLRRAEEARRTAEAEGRHRPVMDAIVDVCRERAGRLIGAG